MSNAPLRRTETPTKLPIPRVRRRPLNAAVEREAIASGLAPLAARILAARVLPHGLTPAKAANPSLGHLDPPTTLKGIERAAARIADAIVQGQDIAVFGDYDADGLCGHAILREALVRYFGHPESRFASHIGHRLLDGYGLTDSVVDRILEQRPLPAILITTDCGSSDEARIGRLAAIGVDVVVTDHHTVPPEGVPASAYVTINPKQEGCGYPDKAIAGGYTAWLVMAAVRQELIARGNLKTDAPNLAPLLDYAALSTVADCVSIASPNNRAVVRAGLKQINAGARAAWRAIRPHLGEPEKEVTAETIAFGLAPRLNSRSRLEDPQAALRYLLAQSTKEAEPLVELLNEENERRKEIERVLREQALAEAATQTAAGARAITVFLPEGHAGINGLCASRCTEAFGCPSIVFSPKPGEPDHVTGSGRSIEAFNLRDALQAIADENPGLLGKFGGHHMACGLTVARQDVEHFSKALAMLANGKLAPSDIGPVIWTDGELDPGAITLETLGAIQSLEPYGREFDPPVFEGRFTVRDLRVVGRDAVHLQLMLSAREHVFRAIWFRALERAGDTPPCSPGEEIYAIFSLSENVYRGERSARLRLLRAEPLREEGIGRPAKPVPRRYI